MNGGVNDPRCCCFHSFSSLVFHCCPSGRLAPDEQRLDLRFFEKDAAVSVIILICHVFALFQLRVDFRLLSHVFR